MRILALTLTILLTFANTAQAASKDPAEGLWLTQNERSVIEIKPCEQGLCGYIYWIIPGGMQFDAQNPDKTKRGEPMCGLPILWGFEKERAGTWENGTIYKADDGDLYDANIEVLEDDTLKVRGYMGLSLFGKTQIWQRVSSENYEICKLPQ